MGVNRLTGRVILLDGAKFDYTPGQIRRFIAMWNEGKTPAEIAAFFKVRVFEVALLVMHCEVEDLIQPRPGGFLGK